MLLPYQRFTTCMVAVLLCILTACGNADPGVWINNEIPSGQHDDFKELNQTLLKGLQTNEPKLVETIMSATMMQNSVISRTIELCSIRMKMAKIKLLDEFYVVHEFRRAQRVYAKHHGINSYLLSYQPTERETYIALFTIQSNANTYLLTANYNKLDYGWKLVDLELGTYALNNKTAPEWYQYAKQRYAKGYLIDAVNTLNTSRSCGLPSVLWRYTIEPEVNAFYTRVINQAQAAYSFPVTVNQLPTHPQIFRVFNEPVHNGIFPMIYYLSKINLKDTAAVNRENKALRNVIGQVFPGINADKQYLQYTVFNEYPKPNRHNAQFLKIEDKLQ